MDRILLENLCKEIKGCTFASLDTVTEPMLGYRKVTKGLRVLLLSNKKSSGYENMVKRRLMAAGKNPNDFVLGDLPWGERIEGTPLISHKGKVYLQYIELSVPHEKIYSKVTGKEFTPEQLGMKPSRTNQGLSPSDEVIVRCVDVDNIVRVAMMNEDIVADKKTRSILHLPS